MDGWMVDSGGCVNLFSEISVPRQPLRPFRYFEWSKSREEDKKKIENIALIHEHSHTAAKRA